MEFYDDHFVVILFSNMNILLSFLIVRQSEHFTADDMNTCLQMISIKKKKAQETLISKAFLLTSNSFSSYSSKSPQGGSFLASPCGQKTMRDSKKKLHNRFYLTSFLSRMWSVHICYLVLRIDLLCTCSGFTILRWFNFDSVLYRIMLST